MILSPAVVPWVPPTPQAASSLQRHARGGAAPCSELLPATGLSQAGARQRAGPIQMPDSVVCLFYKAVFAGDGVLPTSAVISYFMLLYSVLSFQNET